MEAVKAFNSELSSLYEVKPPISKAKMTAITRGAIKAIKFYKHVVQSVEKFILKCKPEYKVPGLYVIDSIVRQSRHQFGTDKDVFAPRFAKNMQQTFINLFKCPPEDKSKIIRVLNLWQKNQVFQAEVIQPLFDLADPNHPIHKEMIGGGGAAATSNNGITTKGSPALQKTPTKIPQQGSDATTLHLGGVSNNPTLLNADPNVLAQLQQLHRWIVRAGGDSAAKAEGPPVHFDKKLLDYDYGDDEEEATNPSPKVAAPNANDSVSSLLSNPEVLRHLQTLQQSELDLEKLRKLQEMKQQEEEFDKHLAQTVPNLPFASECEFKPTSNNVPPGLLPNSFFMSTTDVTQPPPNFKPNYEVNQQQDDSIVMSESNYPNNNSNDNGDIEVITLDHGDSRSGSPREDRYRRRRSRSRSRERRRSRRSRSRSHSRSRRHRTRSRDREREKEREKEKERKKRGLPPIKKEHLSVCSTTLWVGHLSKLVHQEELSDTFGEFGDVVSIDLIPPRGCAFIIMHRRQDAARCLTKLKNYKLQGKAITVAWAPGKGVKGKDLKDYWEGDLGVSYVPWSKLKPDIDLEMLEDGGMIDEDTMPDWLKERNAKPTDKPPLTEPSPSIDISQPPPVGQSLLGLPLVPPPFPGRVLGMNLMPNVPIGVPPPPTPTVLANQLLGIGSPFQAPPPPGLLQLPVEKPDEDGLVRFGMVQPPPLPVMHEDNMDVEMEDAERPRAGSLSEQLLASMDGGGDLQAAVNRLNAIANHRPNPGGLGSDLLVDEVGGGRRRSRSRGRDRDRLRGDGSRERMRDRSRGDRRGGNNRWGGVDRMRDRDDRREKTVNDRLREMAEGYTNHERPREELIPLPRPLPPPFALEPPPQPIIEDDRDDRYPMRPEFCHPDEYHHLEYDYRREQQQYEIGDRFLRARRADPFLEERREFEPRMPPDFYPGRDAFGGPRGPPLMRGMGPEGGGFMHRPPGMRPQRGGYRGGPMMRGARAPGWNDRSNSNFGPRFETPGDFYPRRFNDRSRERKRFRQDEVDVQDVRVEPEGGARRSSRWSSGSPRSKETEAVEEVVKVEGGCEENVKVATVVEGEEMGNTTPLHDEPLEKGAEPPTIVAVETDAAPVEVECETNATEITECN